MSDKLKEHLMKWEGMENEPYQDTQDYKTVGIGANLDAVGTDEHLKAMGLDAQNLDRISDEQAQELFERQLSEKNKIFQNIRSNSFPNANIMPNEQDALMSMLYQNVGLIGPNMRGHLASDDDAAAFKEILLNSNKDKEPGIQRRRLDEAKMYAGERYEDFLSELSPEQIQELKTILENIKNPHTREQVFEEFPELVNIAPSNRFNKLAKSLKD